MWQQGHLPAKMDFSTLLWPIPTQCLDIWPTVDVLKLAMTLFETQYGLIESKEGPSMSWDEHSRSNLELTRVREAQDVS